MGLPAQLECRTPTGSLRSEPGVRLQDVVVQGRPEGLCEDFQRDCPTSFDFQGMTTELRVSIPGLGAPNTAGTANTAATGSCIKRSNWRWSDLEDDDEDQDSDILWLHYTSAASVENANNGTAGANAAAGGWAWDAASATNSDVPEEPTDRRGANYPASEPPRMRGSNKFGPRTREAKPDRQNRHMRHHTKKEVHLPPRPTVRHQPLRSTTREHERHLQEVERDHLPTRFHREDQRQALSKEMQESAQQMYQGWGSQKRMSTVLAAMEELPKRVGEDMHKLASHVVDSVQSEINEVSTVIRGESEQSTETTKAMKHLEVIPTMVLNLLESRMEKAKAQVREKVGGMIQQLSAIHEEDAHEGGEVLAEQMQDMSSEVAKIAGDAVEAAAQECRAHATQQLDIALASLREPLGPPGPADEQEEDEAAIKWQKVCKIRNAVEDDLLLQKNVDSIFPAATHNAMETALEVIKDKDFMPHSVTNEVVADQLLRAKVRGRGDVRAPSSVGTGGLRDARDVTAPRNPGSLGHPDLCPRPCIYYRSGTCTSGADCTFCHLSHSRRPLRLDKRHREALKRMPFRKLLNVVVPILTSKVAALAEEKLSSLCEVAVEADANTEQDPGTPVAEPDPPEATDEATATETALEALSSAAKVNMAEIKMDVLQILEQLARNAGLTSLDLARPPSATATSSRLASTCSTGSSSSDQDSGRDKKVWLRALQVMNLRSLLVMIRRLARDAGSAEDLRLLEQIIARIQSAFGRSAPDFEEDEPDRFEAVKEEEPLGVAQELASPPANTAVAPQPQVLQLRLSQLVS